MIQTTVLVTGGKGKLGRALSSQSDNVVNVVSLGRDELDITEESDVIEAIAKYKPSAVINCAGILSLKSETNRDMAWAVNVIGTLNLGRLCVENEVRLVHISTDYVFDGEKGNYSEFDTPNPINYYGLSKLAGEVAVLALSPYFLVMRVPFRYSGPWGYDKVFVDQWTSGRWIHEVAPDIVRAATAPALCGLIHVGGQRKNLYNMAREVSPKIGTCLRESFKGFRIPQDVSLNSSRWHDWCTNHNWRSTAGVHNAW